MRSPRMVVAGEWAHRPQRVWLRKAIFQIHLWLGLALGLYIVVLSLKAVWAIVGVVPAIMFVTGLIMWWNRVVRRRLSGTIVESV